MCEPWGGLLSTSCNQPTSSNLEKLEDLTELAGLTAPAPCAAPLGCVWGVWGGGNTWGRGVLTWTRPPAARGCRPRSRERGEGGGLLPGCGRRRGRVRTRRFENTLWELAKSLRPAVHGVAPWGLALALSPPCLRGPARSGLSGEWRPPVLLGPPGARTCAAQAVGRAAGVPGGLRQPVSRPRGCRSASSGGGPIRGPASVRPACGARAGGSTRRSLRFRNHGFL